MMDMKDVMEYIKDNVKDYLPPEYENATINEHEVMKHNDTMAHGISIELGDNPVTSNIYIDQLYEAYKNGDKSLDDIVSDVADAYIEDNINIDPKVVHSLRDYDVAKDSLMLRVCDTEDNKQRLENLANHNMGDYSATIHIIVEENSEGLMSVPVTKGIRDFWGVDDQTLLADALKSDAQRTPFLATLMATMDNMMFDTPIPNLLEDGVEPDYMDMPMYCLSNESKLNGAAVLVHDDVMQKVGDILGENFYVLPSSIHETLLVPESAGMPVSELTAMVKEANDTVVADHDRLSFKVQYYDRETGVLENAQKREDRVLAAKQKGKEKEAPSKEKKGLHARLDQKKEQVKNGPAKDSVKKQKDKGMEI